MGLWFVLSFFTAILFLAVPRGHCARIVGGQVAVPHSRPYMAAIMSGDVFHCGGTLIQPNWVLSAAHCDIQIEDKVILGAHSLTKPEKEKQEFLVTRVIKHADYNRRTLEHDIVLLQLKGAAKITKAVKILKLSTVYDDIQAGTQCQVTGWGSTENGGKESDTLREADVTVVKRDICKKNYKGKPVVTTNMVCAGGGKKPRTDACEGDSGGPLICGGIQRGITSFGKKGKCGDPKYPGVYTLLTKDYIEWIKKKIGRNLD